MADNRDDVLLQRLQTTIDSWSTEVTAAHEGLARQIGDARQQLVTLIDTLNRRAKSSNGNGADALRSRALEERDTALREVMERNRDLDETLHQLQEERRTLHQQIEVALADVQDLRGQVAAHQEQEAATARLIEMTDRELASLRKSMAAASSGRAAIDDEVLRLRAELEVARSDRAAIAAERDSLKAELQTFARNAEHARHEVESLTTLLKRVEADSANRERSQDDRVAELTSELAAAERMLRDQKDKLSEASNDRTRFAEQLALLQTEIEVVAARADRHESAGREALAELNGLRLERDEQVRAATALRAEIEAAREATDSLSRAERELRDELASLSHQYERQSARLAETERELEAHTSLSVQANHREDAHKLEIAALQRELDAARELAEQQKRRFAATVDEAKSGSWQLESRLTELTKENSDLRKLLESAEVRPSAPTAAQDEELAHMREELLAFEQILVEREQAVEAAAARMQKLEETALRVQSEVASLRAGRDAPAPSIVELEQMRSRADRLEKANAEQAARIVEQEVELSQRREEIAQLQAEFAAIESAAASPEDEAPVLSPSAAFPAHDAKGHKKSMGEILVESGIITGNQLASALDEQRTAKKRRLGSILVEKGLIREEIVAQVVASQLKLPFVRLGETKIHRSAVALLDGRLATHHMCFPIAATTEEIVVAMANPLDLIAIEDLEFATHLKVRPVVATLSDITSAIVEYYGVTIANAIAEDTFDVQSPPRAPSQPQHRPQK